MAGGQSSSWRDLHRSRWAIPRWIGRNMPASRRNTGRLSQWCPLHQKGSRLRANLLFASFYHFYHGFYPQTMYKLHLYSINLIRDKKKP